MIGNSLMSLQTLGAACLSARAYFWIVALDKMNVGEGQRFHIKGRCCAVLSEGAAYAKVPATKS